MVIAVPFFFIAFILGCSGLYLSCPNFTGRTPLKGFYPFFLSLSVTVTFQIWTLVGQPYYYYIRFPKSAQSCGRAGNCKSRTLPKSAVTIAAATGPICVTARSCLCTYTAGCGLKKKKKFFLGTTEERASTLDEF